MISACKVEGQRADSLRINLYVNVPTQAFQRIEENKNNINQLSKGWFQSDECKKSIQDLALFITNHEPLTYAKEYNNDLTLYVNSVTQKNSQSNGGGKAKYPHSSSEILVIYVIGITLLILNFLGSINYPKYRYLFINTPYDLGIKETKNDAQKIVQKKRNNIEFALLVIAVIAFMIFTADDKKSPEVDIANAALLSAGVFLLAYLFYIVVRLGWGYSTQCPSCKNMFAAKCTNSWDEPNGTFQTRERTGESFKGANHAGYIYTVKTIEHGTRHSDNECSVCNHQWHTTSSYKKTIDSHSVTERP